MRSRVAPSTMRDEGAVARGHHVTPTEFTSIASNGADWWDVTWYTGELPGTVHVDGA